MPRTRVERSGAIWSMSSRSRMANRWIAYVCDVSGHGVHAGVVMGMVKSAARMALTRHATLDGLFRDLNEVLLPLKSSSMFVTAAAIEASADGWRVSVAGHCRFFTFAVKPGRSMRSQPPTLPWDSSPIRRTPSSRSTAGPVTSSG